MLILFIVIAVAVLRIAVHAQPRLPSPPPAPSAQPPLHHRVSSALDQVVSAEEYDHMRPTGVARIAPWLLTLGLLTACGGEDESTSPASPAPSSAKATTATTTPTTQDEASDEAGADPAGDACALLDPAFLDSVMEGSTTMLGGPFEFGEPLQQSPTDFCSWRETNSQLSMQLTLEPAAASEIEDHSGRAYNIDVPPVPIPRDGPGTDAVLLTDTAFADVGGEGIAYGYFFVADDVTVFIESVGLEVTADQLRAMADEAANRLGLR